MSNVRVTTRNRKTGEIHHHLIRQLPHDIPMKVGKTLWGGKIIDIRPADTPDGCIPIEALDKKSQNLLEINLGAFSTSALERYCWTYDCSLSRAIELELASREIGGVR